MLAVSPLMNCNRNEEIQSFSMDGNEFADFTNGNLLDSIDFDDLFLGISDGDSLPDLDMDPDILAEFSSVNSIGDELMMNETFEKLQELENCCTRKEEDKAATGSVSASDLGSGTSSLIQGDEIVSKLEERNSVTVNPSRKEGDKGRKSSAHSKNHPGKRKMKIDWTPDLHRKFVQAVEQLGVDKAVPSRILEIMGIDCLTRHNIASHLQKYRSHRKHLLAREAEAVSWNQRRQIYVQAPAACGVQGKRDVNPWIAPSMGFSQITPMPHHFRPLHVWGHPSVDQSMVHMWPKFMTPPPRPLPPHSWPPTQPPHSLRPLPPSNDSSFWHSHHQHVATPGTPYFPPHLPPARFPVQPMTGVSPPSMYKVNSGLSLPTGPPGQTLPHPPSDIHPSKESVDEAIEDVLSKPWMPLPLGLKPPSIDSVMVELQRQGVPKIPPSTCA